MTFILSCWVRRLWGKKNVRFVWLFAYLIVTLPSVNAANAVCGCFRDERRRVRYGFAGQGIVGHIKFLKAMLRLNCFFKAKKGKYNEALEAAILLTAKTQKHEGMVSYDVFESATRKDIFMFCETWESEEALARHAATPEFKECVGIIESCGEMKIEKLQL